MTSPAPIARHNSTVSGSVWPELEWSWLRFDERVWVDPGLGDGPYLKVPCEPPGFESDGIVHRVRPRRKGYVPVKREDGVWCWGRA